VDELDVTLEDVQGNSYFTFTKDEFSWLHSFTKLNCIYTRHIKILEQDSVFNAHSHAKKVTYAHCTRNRIEASTPSH
jgi:hypothetical protein